MNEPTVLSESIKQNGIILDNELTTSITFQLETQETMKKQHVYTFQEALAASAEYFGESHLEDQNKLVSTTFLNKYAMRDNDGNLLEKTPVDMHNRIAAELHRIEKSKFKTPLTHQEIFNYLDHFKKIVPQGSPMMGIGNNHQFVTLSNCYVIPAPEDSYGGIMLADQQLVQISKRRGGVGFDLSNLRPSGSATHNAARTSTGVISFMKRFSNSTREVGQSGRRGALMLSISIHHPESVILLPEGEKPKPVVIPADPENNMPEIHTTTEFYNPDCPDVASVKYDRKQITGANVSIRLTNEFLKAVANGEKFEQRWPVDSKKPIISKMVDARRVWKKIIRAAWQMAEPGLLFWDNIINESPADCYADQGFETTSTNPCSEIPLSPYDSCRLMAMNVYSYVRNPFTKDAEFDYQSFYQDAQICQRLMDDLVDLEIESVDRIIEKIKSDPESDESKQVELNLWTRIRKACIDGRRTGTGIVGLGDALAAMGIKYGSDDSIKAVDKIYKTLKLGAYRGSVNLAKEIGPFPIWDFNKEKNNPFLRRIQEEDHELYEDMKKYGRRNIALLTTAPTGTVSMMTQTTGGIEPLTYMSSIRKRKVNPNDQGVKVDSVDKTGDSWQHFEVFHPPINEWMKITGEKDISKSPWSGCCAEDLDWKKRVKLQAVANRHIDHAISSTVNLPEEVSEEKVAEIYETAWSSGCKGITIYRKNCRTGVILEKVQNKKCENCDDASLALQTIVNGRPTSILTSYAPKRPKHLKCDIHRCKIEKEDWLFFVGLWPGTDAPFEVFGGSPKGFKIPKKVTTGWIEKDGIHDGRTTYDLILGDLENEDEMFRFENIAKRFEKYDKGPFTRVISLVLRHGVPIKFLIEQLSKDPEADMFDFSRGIARVLKKYIAEGETSGVKCSNCGSDRVVYRNGCPTCQNCNFSTCS